MKVPVSWLREYVAVDAATVEIADRLAIATGEVERISFRGVADVDGNYGHYLVGRVLEAGRHPNADRLQLCSVDVGEDEPRQIVCGAWNFGEGATVAVALPGAVLPDGRTLERAKLRGTVSDGMILSESELQLSSDHAGILVLPEPWEPGTPLGDVLPLGEEVLEIELTRNRPDCLSVYGIAREVGALFAAELRPMPGREPELAGEETPDITIEDYEGCPRYIGRLFRDVRVGPSPPWLKARLSAAGMRPIANVVDVTNYVMLALGNPLHAFDFDTLRGGRIVVRRARPGEEFTSLDGNLRKLDPADLVIADAERAIAIGPVEEGRPKERLALRDDVENAQAVSGGKQGAGRQVHGLRFRQRIFRLAGTTGRAQLGLAAELLGYLIAFQPLDEKAIAVAVLRFPGRDIHAERHLIAALIDEEHVHPVANGPTVAGIFPVELDHTGDVANFATSGGFEREFIDRMMRNHLRGAGRFDKSRQAQE